MIRTFIHSLALVGILCSCADATEWARKMFKVTTHDFGNVARGAKTIYRFEMTNLYKEDVHISGVRASCGCTTPLIENDKRTLKTWETGAILARFNTDSFLGSKGATLTVTIDKPYFAEVQLQVKGYIRSDLTFEPGVIQFGEVEQGQAARQTVTVSRLGRSDWAIQQVRCGNKNVQASFQELSRAGGRVSYQLTVDLDSATPAGYLADRLTLLTNDATSQEVFVSVEGYVAPAVSIRPDPVLFGEVQPGETVAKRLVVSGKKPFKILEVQCGDSCFQFNPTDEAKQTHVIPVKFHADKTPRDVLVQIRVLTDLGSGMHADCVASAKILPAEDAIAKNNTP